jgi:hypothetical protein
MNITIKDYDKFNDNMDSYYKYTNFMLDSNRIEGEDCNNPGDIEAVQLVIDGIENKKDLLKVHRALTRHLKVEWSGRYRKCQVYIGGFTPVKPEYIEEKMKDYFNRLSNMDSFEAHNEFEKIHPFRDFNGRVGRLIWLSKAVREGYNFELPFLQKYYYQTLNYFSFLK